MNKKRISPATRVIGRRDFLAQTVLGGGALALGSLPVANGALGAEAKPVSKTDRSQWLSQTQQRTPLAPPPKITDVSHVKLCYDPGRYCGHPRQGIFKYFGNGEIIVGHNHAPCEYKKRNDASHGADGYHS
ncbi:MAG: twin-arginine translocation signal domain-containing protein, partial [Sedimentisphaerales bacterium]|nr:twin-arginine translocation signal domain-containing protein [Sedimentisphaerales bacterium]